MPKFVDEKYERYLKAFTSLSKLFSDNDALFLHPKFMELLFCHVFNAKNIAVSNKAFDAIHSNNGQNSIGVALKTFGLHTSKKDPFLHSVEKIAEFTKDGPLINKLIAANKLDEALLKIIELRNYRINVCNNEYGIKAENNLYHCIGRKGKDLIIFEDICELLDITKVEGHPTLNKNSFFFINNGVEYKYSVGKSTLYKKFIVPEENYRIKVEPLSNPFDILERISETVRESEKQKKEFIIVPLYSAKRGEDEDVKIVPEKSGLNAWNAGGRKRKYGEIYIPFPSDLRKIKRSFFPASEVIFILKTAKGDEIKARICQDGDKAIMTNPNHAMSRWLLKDILELKEYELLTYDKLIDAGVDSLKITKESDLVYSIETCGIGSYEHFLEQIDDSSESTN